MNLELCRSCNAPIIWAQTTAGKTMPVDADVSDAGTLVLEERDGGPPLARPVPKGDRYAALVRGDLRTSHLATCPERDEWRKGRAS